MRSSSLKTRVFVTALGALALGSAALAADTKTISSVEVQERNGATRIVLRGAEDPIYTAFMREDPPRLIVELPDVIFSGIDSPIRVENGLVHHVTFGAFGDPRVALSMARVSVGLARSADYELLPSGDELVIEIRASDREAPAVERDEMQSAAAEPEAAAPAEEASADDAAQAEHVDPAPAEDPAPTPSAPASSGAEESAGTETPDAETGADLAPASAEAEPQHLAAPSEAETESPASETAGASSEPSTPAQGSEAPTTFHLTGVEWEAEGILVRADGPIDNIDAFTLDEPTRLVVDFWGVQNQIWPARRSVEWGTVQGVRVGQHPDKVRVVFDLAGPLESHSVVPLEQGARIHLAELQAAEPAAPSSEPAAPSSEPAAPSSEEEAPAAAEASDEGVLLAGEETVPEAPAASSPEPEDRELEGATTAAAEWSEPGFVHSVHFESLPQTDRVVVSLNHPVQAELVTPDPRTVIVLLKDVGISEEAERRVDTKDFNGPIEHFSVFETPDVDYQEVRIVLKRSSEVPAELSWQDNQLHVEVARATAQTTWTGDEFAAAEQSGEAAGETGATPGPGETPAPAPEASADSPSDESAESEVPLPSPLGAALSQDDPFLFDGPADPASIDVLEEGGFSDEKEYTGRRISLDFKDADIANILRLIAEVSDLNVIAGEEVSGKVTIRLVDVPWDQALDVVLLTKGLGFIRVGNVLRIAPLETLKLEQEARLQDRRAKEKLEDLVVKLQPVNYANVREVQDLVKKLLSKRGTVNMDSRTNTLIIKDIPSVVQEATALVKAIDTQTPQVLIEAKIVEASLSFSRSLGSFWGTQYNAVGTSGLPSSGGAPDFHLADGVNPDVFGIGSQLTNFIASNPIFDANNGLLNLGILGLDDHIQLDLVLEAAESNAKGKVISSPRVVTLDNREAVIKQGVAIKFEAATRDKITISFIDAVLELKVTPHITANRSIIMKLKVSRNAPSISAATGDIVGIDKNEATTETLVRDGETLVLGGIYVVDSGKNATKTPFLADIPLLGAAFQSKVAQDERRELLIFVTPRIIMGAPATTDL